MLLIFSTAVLLNINYSYGTEAHSSVPDLDNNLEINNAAESSNPDLDSQESNKNNLKTSVTDSNPAPDTVGVPLDAEIRVNFSQPIEWGTGWVRLRDLDRREDVSISKSIDGNVLRLTPNSNLTPGTNYGIILHSNSIKSLEGHFLSLYQSNFRTRSSSPVVDKVVPANDSANVELDSVIRITFNQKIQLGSGWVRLRDVDRLEDVPITTKIINDDLYLILQNNLRPGTNYNIIIHSDSLTSIAGHPISLYQSNFKTKSINLLKTTGNSFTQTQIGDAAVRVRNFIDNNRRLPNFVTISGISVDMPSFLHMMVTSLDNGKNGKNGNILEYYLENPTNMVVNDNQAGDITRSEYLNLANTLRNQMENSGKTPESANLSLGKIGYQSLIHLYSRIMAFEYQNNVLPNFVSITSSTIGNSVTSLGNGQLNGLNGIEGLEILARYINRNLNHRSGAGTTAEIVERTGFGDCWGLSAWAAKVLHDNGYTVRIVQGATSASYNHRWLHVLVDGRWVSFEPSAVTRRYGGRHYSTVWASVRNIVATFN